MLVMRVWKLKRLAYSVLYHRVRYGSHPYQAQSTTWCNEFAQLGKKRNIHRFSEPVQLQKGLIRNVFTKIFVSPILAIQNQLAETEIYIIWIPIVKKLSKQLRLLKCYYLLLTKYYQKCHGCLRNPVIFFSFVSTIMCNLSIRVNSRKNLLPASMSYSPLMIGVRVGVNYGKWNVSIEFPNVKGNNDILILGPVYND